MTATEAAPDTTSATSGQQTQRPQARGGSSSIHPVLRLKDLRVGISRNGAEAVRGVHLDLYAGETVAIVGESGSGKSLTALSVMGLLPAGVEVTGGAVLFHGTDLTRLGSDGVRHLRGEQLSIVFQNHASALNPCFTVGSQIAELFRRRRGKSRSSAREHALDLMRQVGIPDPASRYEAYPHEFSGGMRQRAMIAVALALDPTVLLADEPTTALDVTVQAQILRLLAERRSASDLAMLLVSHDLGVVARMAGRVAVMYAGRIVEQGRLSDVYGAPAHPYTAALLRATPASGAEAGSGSATSGERPPARLATVPGQAPDPAQLPTGCAFHPRCQLATAVCRTTPPEPRTVGPDRVVECHHAEQLNPKVHHDPSVRGAS